MFEERSRRQMDELFALQQEMAAGLDIVPRLTLIVDASWRKEFSGAAWWLNGPRGRTSGSASFYSESSGKAEIMAILLAVNVLIVQKHVLPGDLLLIQSDNEQALRQTYVFALPLTVEMRHVPGHTGNTDNRSRAQAWCDRHAREAREKLEREYVNTRPARRPES